LINYAINECNHIAAANEGDAVAVAAGAYLGGRKSVVLMQNSGLTNAVSPLTSLNFPFRIPVLGFVSLRGEEAIGDEPQHELMGQITTDLLDIMRVKWEFLSSNQEEAYKQLKKADQWINMKTTFFFVIKKGTFEEEQITEQRKTTRQNLLKIEKSKPDESPSRLSALTAISKYKDRKTVLLATTGKTGRELYEVEDSDHNLYMVGSLGCISSIGLGLALTKKDKKIIVIDGDGSLLMRMGSMATTAHYNPTNMLHILLDNNSHDSTGGQSTVSHDVDFVSVAASCSYENSVYIHDISELQANISKWKENQRLTFLYMNIQKGSKKNLGRPKITPFQVKERLKEYIANG
jgi:phosphonopyruvate decarboxylase